MEYKSKVLSNGLKSLVIDEADSLSVTILILVRVGSRFEKEENAGVAHFVEHTIFKGTTKRPKTKEIAMEVEKLGAMMNAFTSYDYTGYYIKIPKEKFIPAFEVLADMFLNSTFKQEEIEKERGVILEEMNMYDDQPMEKVTDVFASHLFANHPLGREIIGTKQSIKSIQRKDFLQFIDKYYGGENTMAVVSGGIDPDEAMNAVEKYLGNIPSKKFAKIDEFKTHDLNQKVVNLTRPISQSHLMLGGYALPRGSKDKYVLKVANAIFAKGFGSRLFQVIRDELGLAYYVYSQINEFEEVGSFNIGLGVENSKVQSAVSAVLKELNSLAKGDFTEEEIERAKNYLIGNLTTGLESSDDIGLWYGLQYLLDNEIKTVEEVKQKIRSVEKEQIMQVWSGLVKPDNLLLASVSPHEDLKVDLSI